MAGSDLLDPSHTDTSNAAVKEPKNPRQHQPNKKQTMTRLERSRVPKNKEDGLVESSIEELKVAKFKEELRKRKCPVGRKKA